MKGGTLIPSLSNRRQVSPYIHSCTAIDVSSGNACIVQESPEHSLVHPHCSHGSTCIQKPVRWVSRPFTQKNSTHSGRMYMYLNIFLFQRLTLGRNLRKILNFTISCFILRIWNPKSHTTYLVLKRVYLSFGSERSKKGLLTAIDALKMGKCIHYKGPPILSW